MRTTIELRNEQRARPLKPAARRGEKGLSRLVAEAVARSLAQVDAGGPARDPALSARGNLPTAEATELRERLRGHWR